MKNKVLLMSLFYFLNTRNSQRHHPTLQNSLHLRTFPNCFSIRFMKMGQAQGIAPTIYIYFLELPRLFHFSPFSI
ncbi:MAG TPA: hypothetical protein DCM38_00720 [Gammaproteobacteria bacterium]|nr:hypothetical protein [Gammaproteobacteria bacterium]